MAFITVFGKTRGESPRTPRSRNPSAKLSEERKSPQCDPSTSPTAASWPGWRPASRQGEPGRDHGRAGSPAPAGAPPRPGGARVTSAGLAPEPAPAPIGREGADRRRCPETPAGERCRPTAAPPAAPSALTLPIPVTTTRAGGRSRSQRAASRLRGTGGAPEEEAQVLTAEPEGVRHGALERGAGAPRWARSRTRSRGPGRARLAVGGISWWTSVSTVAIASRAPAAAIACPTRDLLALTSTASGSKSLWSAAASTRSFWGVPGPVSVDVSDRARRDARPIQRLRHRPDAALPVGVRRREVPGVRGEAVAGELRVAARAARPGVRLVLEHDEARALAERHAPAVPGERAARLGIEQLERVEAHEADAGHGVDPARERERHLAGGDQLGREPERRAARAAGENHGLLGARSSRSAARRRRRGRTAGRSEATVRSSGSSTPSRSRRQNQASASSMPPPMPPTITAAGRSSARESPASRTASSAAATANRSARERREDTPGSAMPAGTSAPIRARKPSVSKSSMGRTAHRPAARPCPERATARAVGADDSEPGDEDALHVVIRPPGPARPRSGRARRTCRSGPPRPPRPG